jgi:hypothetical protein
VQRGANYNAKMVAWLHLAPPLLDNEGIDENTLNHLIDIKNKTGCDRKTDKLKPVSILWISIPEESGM